LFLLKGSEKFSDSGGRGSIQITDYGVKEQIKMIQITDYRVKEQIKMIQITDYRVKEQIMCDLYDLT
jgi:hypothetical protein